MHIQSIRVIPNIIEQTAPDFFFANSRVAAIRLVMPLTMSKAIPENTKSVKSTSANGSFLK